MIFDVVENALEGREVLPEVVDTCPQFDRLEQRHPHPPDEEPVVRLRRVVFVYLHGQRNGNQYVLFVLGHCIERQLLCVVVTEVDAG